MLLICWPRGDLKITLLWRVYAWNSPILSFDPNEKQSVICKRKQKIMKRIGAVESDSVKSARKAKEKLHKACERASETCEQTLHGQEQNRMRMASMRVTRQ